MIVFYRRIDSGVISRVGFPATINEMPHSIPMPSLTKASGISFLPKKECNCNNLHVVPLCMPKGTREKSAILQWQRPLEVALLHFNQKDFISSDPIQVPHACAPGPDREIMAFFSAIFAWGQRKTIINKAKELYDRMDRAPYAFVLSHQDTDLKRLQGFCHRTFNDTDLLYCIAFLHAHYRQSDTLEDAFLLGWDTTDEDTAGAITGFHDYFFSLPYPSERTRKHIPSPTRGSSCKRLNMLLRWMVRCDTQGVDFGCWNTIRMDQLVIPLDVHVGRVARTLGLLRRKQDDWQAAVELTHNLRLLCPEDPVRYDFALFGMGVLDKTCGSFMA